MARQYEQQVSFVGIAWMSKLDRYRDFVQRHDLGFFPHAIDPDGSLFARFGIRYQPGWVFVDDGGEVETVAGALSEAQLASRLDALVAG